MFSRLCSKFWFTLFLVPGCVWGQVAVPPASLIETEPGVRIEAYDWGGSGPALVLLAGLGAKGSDFAAFAGALHAQFHVYSVTRRGYGSSSAPEPTAENYSADRLADDVLTLMERLHLAKPLLVGHSLAGEELSSIGSRHPERVSGLVYLDAGYRYALSGPGLNDLQLDMISMRRYLTHALDDVDPAQGKKSVDAFLSELPDFVKELQAYSHSLGQAAPVSPADVAEEEKARRTPEGRAERAILDSEQRYSSVKCPMLVFFAYPHDLPATVRGAERESREGADMAFVDQRIRLFKAQPDAKVVLLPQAAHGVQDSRQGEVVKEIEAFAARVER
jgi:pimeloyl-ACP methyl ester carboxylesterase